MGDAWTTVLARLADLLAWFADALAPLAGTWSWGLAIVALTVLIRVLLLPLGIAQARGIRTRRALAPQVRRIQDRYDTSAKLRSKDPDRFMRNLRRQQDSIRDLNREHGVRPGLSFLVVLAQSPVLFTLFRLLQSPDVVPALATAPFAWITNLSASVLAGAGFGAIILLIVIAGATWYGTVQAAPPRPEPSGGPAGLPPARMGLVTAGVITAIGTTLPAGVLLYWATTGMWTVAQQAILLR